MKTQLEQNRTRQWQYAAALFVFSLLYQFLVVGKCKLWSVDDITYAYYLVDYSFGFLTRFLPGAFYHLFFKEVYVQPLNICLTVLMVLLFLFVCAALAKLITACQTAESRKTLLVLSLFFLTGPCTFSMFITELGMLDVYWLFFSALFLVCVSNRYLKYFIPLLALLSVLVHFSVSVCYFLFFVFVLLLRIVLAQEKKEKITLGIILGVSAVLVVASSAYFVLHEEGNLVYSLEQFNQALDVRNHLGKPVSKLYYNCVLYRQYDFGFTTLSEMLRHPLVAGNGIFAKAVNAVYFQLKLTYFLYRNSPYLALRLVMLLVVIAPLWAVMLRYWRNAVQVAPKKQKVLFVLMAAQFPFTAVCGLCLSPDVSRWMTHAFLIQFSLFFYTVYSKKDAFCIQMEGKKNVLVFLTAIYFGVYCFTLVNPYG